MRITGGESRGRIISGPQGLEARPTASKIRQAFFNILRNKMDGCRFLDLFAGTGLMGIEALSRGAESLIAVEEARRMVSSIENNLKHLGYEAEVICADVRRVIPVLEPCGFDIIYADPPYKSRLFEQVLILLEKHRLLKPDGVLAIEHARSIAPGQQSGCLLRYDQRIYGQAAISFYRRVDAAVLADQPESSM